MGELLAVLFIGTVLLASGLILAFTSKESGRRIAVFMIISGLFIYLVCYLFSPNNDHYRI
jgi:hypothetical protein